MDSIGLQVLAEACQTCNDSYSISSDTEDNKENVYNNQNAFLLPLYCKARGTPLDHQEDRAILQFNTGDEFKHGADLVCSHLVCRQNGVKFRYCAHCKKAVAKRNFRKRHAHHDLNLMYCADVDTKMMDSNYQESNPQFNQQLTPFGNLNGSSQLPPLTKQHRTPLQPIFTETRNFGCQIESNDKLKINMADNRFPTKQKCEEVPQEWIDLYHNRPKKESSTSSMLEWISRVKQVAGIASLQAENHADDPFTKFYFQDTSAFTSSMSGLPPFEEISSSSLTYFDQMFNEVKDEFKGMAPPRIQNVMYTKSKNVPLQISTADVDSNSNGSVKMLDSDGSVMITPKSFMLSEPSKDLFS